MPELLGSPIFQRLWKEITTWISKYLEEKGKKLQKRLIVGFLHDFDIS